MKRENKKEIYSIRKFKVGVGSAVIGLSFLGVYGSLQQAPILNDLIGVKTVYADDSNFNRTETGTVDAGGSATVNKLVPSEEVKAVPNGEKNFNATVAFTTEAGLGSGTLVADDTIVTVAHNFVHLDETTNPISVKENVNKSGDVHVATLPDGKQVRFSNDDVHYWNKEGFVQGYKNDLAIVKLKKAYENEQPAEVVDSAEVPASNSTIHVFGYPQGKLQPILNEKVASTENYGSNIHGIAYRGSKPGASGGGIYNDEGKLIGVNQNGVVDKRSGGIVFSKEQLDWIKSIVRGENAKPVYLEENRQFDKKESNNFELKNSEETNTLHDWIKDKITKLDFSKNTKDEFYGLVSEDGKTYGDVRKIVSDWKDAKLPQGNYSIKKLTIVDVTEDERKSHQTVEEKPLNSEDGVFGYGDLNDTPLTKIDKIIDKENNNEIKPLFYSTENVSGDSLDNPVFYNTEELAEKYKNANPNYNWDKAVLYKGDLEIPYGDRNLKISYFFNRNHQIGTKTKVEFVGDKIKVKTRKLVLKDKIVDEHNDIQDFEVIENNYELDGKPRKIVKETPDMVIDDDPGVLSAIPDGYEANSEIKKLQTLKTGYVFKVKSYEADGTTSYRYFRTWTYPINGNYTTEIPYTDDENYTNLLKSKISYTPDNELDYGKIKIGASSATEAANNVSLIIWSSDEPKSPNDIHFVQTHKPILDGTENKATTRIEYPETEKINSGIFDLNYIIGTKPRTTKELIENRPVKYLGNENLDVNEKVVKEGKDKFKVTTTNYTLVKTEGEKRDVASIFNNHTDEIKEINETDKNVPNLENKGVIKEDVVTYEESEEKVIEKRINKPRVEKTIIPKSIEYVKDDTKDKGLPNETVEGKDGSKSITITETVNEHTGEIIESRGEPVIVNPTNTIIKVPAKTKVERIKDGTRTIDRTTRYDVDPKTGKVTETVTDKLISDTSAEPPVVENPAFDESKIKVVTEELQPTIRYERDDSREKGQPVITVPGEVGQKKITTVLVPDENGLEKDVVTEEIIKPAGETVVKVAVKTKVERFKDGTRTIERTTRYEVDPHTGKVTEAVTDKLISDMSAEPPVVEVPEFNGGVNGDLDGNPLINEKPEFDLSKLPKEDKPAPALTDFNLGTGKNDFGPKKEVPKVEVVPANLTTPRTEEVPSEQKVEAPKVEAVSQTGNTSATPQTAAANTSKGELPNTGTVENTALTLAGISLAGLSLAVAGISLNKKKENQ